MSETLHGNYQSISDMESGVSGTKFFVYVASETKNAHMEWVSKMKSVGHTEVNIQEDADYYLVFCPVKSRIKTDIDEALEGLPDNKAVILVVMHHTFDPDLVIVESRLQELPRNVRLTVDSLFYQGRLLRCNCNDIAWNQIQKTFNIPIPEPSSTKAVFDLSGTKFFVCVASETKNAHMEWVSKMKRVGHTEVNIPEDADYYLVFCPVKSQIKTDIDEALEGLPDNKAVILVVMHHTFDPDLMIVESRLQELPRNVRLTVDSLFYQGRLLGCNRNDIAWNQIQKSLNIPIPEPSWWKRPFNLSGTKFFDYVASEPKNKLMGWVYKMVCKCVSVAWNKIPKTFNIPIPEPSWRKRPFNLSGTKFFVYVASETKNAHMEWVSKMKRVGHTEVNIPEDADYYLVFCPVKSQIKTDIDEALEGLPDNKAVILVVMHHTFDPDLVIVESRLQELPRNVRLTVDSLFHQGRLLWCNRNDIAWNQIQKSLNIPIPEPSWTKAVVDLSGTKFFVYVASETKNTHMEWVSKMKRVGHTEVNIPEDADYYLVFCPVKSRIKTDIDEALEGLPDNKAVILVVMHHTFDPDLVIVESRLQELPRNVRLTVDSLFYQGRLLRCNRNDIAWNQIQKSLNIPIPEPSSTKAVVDSSGTKFFDYVPSEPKNKLMGWVSKMPSWWKRLFNYLVNHKGLMLGIAVGIVLERMGLMAVIAVCNLLVILVIVIVNSTAGKGQTAGGVWKRPNLIQGQKDTVETPDLKKL
ncbi:uncharacterized protein LOC130520042 isoform X5 [Takifugu flavidus]|uniref:uncharacterized protein LOC130520042 isoform X5 n=1 Tax=Takifugu flavidus TaxID=433684 RepID=UPI002544C527|nr:uncharacterized protein LOC130520042 isoform X5 [Takifugu flavidus]